MAIYQTGSQFIHISRLAPNIPDIGTGKGNIGEAVIDFYTTQENAELRQRSIGSRRFILSEDVPATDVDGWNDYVDFNFYMKNEESQLDGFVNFLKTQDGLADIIQPN